MNHHPINNYFHLQLGFKLYGQNMTSVRSYELVPSDLVPSNIQSHQASRSVPVFEWLMAGTHLLFTGEEDQFMEIHRLSARTIEMIKANADLICFIEPVLYGRQIMGGRAQGYVDDLKLLSIGYFTH